MQVHVLLTSGTTDIWEGEDLEVEMVDGYLSVKQGDRPLAMYAQGMWMKFEPIVEPEDPPICGQVHGANEHFYCTLPYGHEGEHNA